MNAIWQEHTMDSGLKVTVLERHDMALVSINLSYRVGSGHEGPGEFGMSHLLEHMMFKGSKNFPQGSIDLFSLKSGGENNAFTTRDYTSYYHLLPSSYWREAIHIEKDRLYNLKPTKASLESEKKVVLEELIMYEDDPFEVLYDWHYANAFCEGHPYHHPIIGYEESLSPLSKNDLLDYYHKYYHPKLAELLVIGDVDTDEIVRELSDWKTSNYKVGSIRSEPHSVPQFGRLECIGMDVDHTKIMLSFPAPNTDQGEDALANLLEEILCGGRSSFLQKTLVEEQELLSSLDAIADINDHGSLFFLSLELRENVEASQALNALYDLLDSFLSNGINEEQLIMAKNRVLYCHFSDHERLEDMSYQLVQWGMGLGYQAYFYDFPKEVEEASTQSLMRFASKVLIPNQMNLALVYPQEQGSPQVSLWRAR